MFIPGFVVPVCIGQTFLSVPFTSLYALLVMKHLDIPGRYPATFTVHDLVLDFDFPLYSITEDFQTCAHAWCCYATRVAHTYDA